jgi:hypothetical protein
MMRPRVVVLTAWLVSSSCAGQTPEPATPATRAGGGGESFGGAAGAEISGKPIGTKLVRDVNDSPKTFSIGKNTGDGHGLGQLAVKVDGQPLWPPQGPGCPELVRCCSDMSFDDGIALACMLAVGRDPDCVTALRTSTMIALEAGATLPPSCPRR